MQKTIKQYASVADQLLFDSLPEDVKAAITRLYGGSANGGYSEADMRDAYEAGFEDCAEEFERRYFREYNFKDWLKYRNA